MDAPDPSTVDLVRRALSAREGLALDTDAVRLFDGLGDGLDRLVIERFGPWYRASGAPEDAVHLPAIRAALPADAPLFWRFGNEQLGASPAGDAALADARREVTESGLRFGVELLPNRNTGLFLDARAARRWVRANSEGRRVLNLFSFTGAFGVAAAAGGARSTVNVDPVPRVQARAEENYRRNGLAVDGRTFWREDALEALKRARKAGAAFEAIVLDPPPAPTGGKRGARVDVTQDLARLVRASAAVLAPGGWLLVLVAHRQLDADALAAEAGLTNVLWRGTSDADFVPAEGSPGLRAVAYTAG